MKTYYSVGIGYSTDMQYHVAPDETCGHKHRTVAAARKCREKLIGYNAKTQTCFAKWYNSYIVESAPGHNSGWNRVN
jgi:hypothetical protein